MGEQSNLTRSYRGVTAVVFGASGFIGRWVARALVDCGARVVLVVRGDLSLSDLGFGDEAQGSVIKADLSRENSAFEVVAKLRPAIVFNLAGYGVDRAEREERDAYAINAELPVRIVEALAERRDSSWHGQQLVHAGSALEYGEIAGDLSESCAPNPTTLYGQSKLAGTLAVERTCAALGVRAVTARLFTVYGDGEHAQRLLPTLIEASGNDRQIPLSAGDQLRDFTYVADVAEGMLRLGLAGSAAPGEIVNLATGRLTSVRGFVEEAARIFGIAPARLEFGALPTRAEEMQHDPVSVKKLRTMLEWVPSTSLTEGIEDTARLSGTV
ncbi:MAG: NAD(P)-dependent oxidoreductase [Anaerolineae bacterium]|nr:NAD(P)-dependent oxidoreductase [Gemmatimonadaceae bacterium]